MKAIHLVIILIIAYFILSRKQSQVVTQQPEQNTTTMPVAHPDIVPDTQPVNVPAIDSITKRAAEYGKAWLLANPDKPISSMPLLL